MVHLLGRLDVDGRDKHHLCSSSWVGVIKKIKRKLRIIFYGRRCWVGAACVLAASLLGSIPMGRFELEDAKNLLGQNCSKRIGHASIKFLNIFLFSSPLDCLPQFWFRLFGTPYEFYRIIQ